MNVPANINIKLAENEWPWLFEIDESSLKILCMAVEYVLVGYAGDMTWQEMRTKTVSRLGYPFQAIIGEANGGAPPARFNLCDLVHVVAICNH